MKGLLLLFTIWSSVDMSTDVSVDMSLKSDVRTIVYNIGTIDANPFSWKTYYFICDGDCEIKEAKLTLSNGRGKLVGYYGGYGKIFFKLKFCEGQFNKLTGLTKCVMLRETGLIDSEIQIRADTKCDNVSLIVSGNVWRISPIPMKVVTQYIGTILKGGAKIYTFVCEGEDGTCDFERISATFNKGGHVELWGWCTTSDYFPGIYCLGADEKNPTLQTCPWTSDENGKGIRQASVTVKAAKDSENVVLNVMAYKSLKGLKPGPNYSN